MKHKNLPQSVEVYLITSSPDELDQMTRYKLANQYGIHPGYLSKIFKDVTGRTLLEAINFEKMKRAEKQLIGNQNLTVGEISELAGFSKINQFRQTFKKTFGLNPAIYRKIRNNSGLGKPMKPERKFSLESVLIYIMTRDLDQLSQLTRAGIAGNFGLSKNYLGTIFKKGVKKTVFEFIRFEQLKRAEHMLITRYDLNIKQIAQMIGMPDAARFRKKFKAVYGLNPYQYRQLYKT